MRGRFMAMTLAGLALGSAPAYAGTWAKVSQDHHSNIVIPALIADGADVLVAWHYQPAPNSEEIDTQRFGSSVTQPYQPHGPRQVSFAGWSLGNPRLFATPAGVQMAFEGTQAISPTQVTTGLIVSGRSPDGTFATPVVAARPYSGDVDALALPDGTPLLATNFTGGIYVARGVDANNAGVDLQAPFASCCGYHPRLGRDAAGRVWVAWYSNASGNTGIYLQQLDPATGQPASPPVKAPASESVYNNSFDVAMACAATCRVVYGGGTATAPAIVSWAAGEGAPTSIASVVAIADAGRVV